MTAHKKEEEIGWKRRKFYFRLQNGGGDRQENKKVLFSPAKQKTKSAKKG